MNGRAETPVVKADSAASLGKSGPVASLFPARVGPADSGAEIVNNEAFDVGFHTFLDETDMEGMRLIEVRRRLILKRHRDGHGETVVDHAPWARHRDAAAKLQDSRDRTQKLPRPIGDLPPILLHGFIRPEDDYVCDHAPLCRILPPGGKRVIRECRPPLTRAPIGGPGARFRVGSRLPDPQIGAMVTIRPALATDIPCLVDFNRALALETEGYELAETTLERGVRRLIEKPEYGFYTVATRPDDPGEVIGCTLITFEWSDWRDGLIWWIQSVYVKKEWRGQGVFRALLDHLEKRARQDPEIRGLRLYVEDENLQAHRTYDRLGLHSARYTVRQKLFNPE